MVSLTCYGGANEIGGNKLLLEDKGTKIYLDFGESFDFGEGYFYDYLKPRKANGLEVYFEFGLLPRISGLYGKEMHELSDLPYKKPDVDGVIISHSHSDHVGHVDMLDESIPIFMGHGTKALMDVYHQLYPTLFNLGEHTDLNLFKSGQKLRIKHLEVEPVHVEHSVPGAYGFIVKTSAGAIAYTGDFRMHGPRSDMTMEFMKKATGAEPHALLCEGTRMGHESEHNFTEAEVEEKVNGIVKHSGGLVLAYFSMSNVDRFMTFYNAAVKNGRKLVISVNLAHIVATMREKVPVLPDVMKDKHIKVYFRLSKTRTFCEKDYRPWEREYCPNMITYKEIAKEPKEYLMHMGFNQMMELVYLKPKEADFIYSMSEHFLEGEENEEQKTVWENWMKHFGIEFHRAHCSGHASRKDLEDFIKKVNPEILIPIHTDSAEEFKKIHSDVRIPEKGKMVKI